MGISYKKVKEIALQREIKSDNALCRLCGIPSGTFNDWKNGNTKSLTEPNILKLANGLKVPVDCLFDEEDKKTPDLKNEIGINPEYYELNSKNRAVIDRMIAELLKSQSQD